MILVDRLAKKFRVQRLYNMWQSRFFAAGLLAVFALLIFVGCNDGVREEVIEIRPAVDPLATVKSILQRYERGEPLGSEAASFDSVVADVKKTDPEKAKMVDEGLKRILQAEPQQRAEASAELLKKISGS